MVDAQNLLKDCNYTYVHWIYIYHSYTPHSYEVLGGLHSVMARQELLKDNKDYNDRTQNVEAKIFIG